MVDIPPLFERLLEAPEKLAAYLERVEHREGKHRFPSDYGTQPKLSYSPEAKSQIGWWRTLASARERFESLTPALDAHLATIDWVEIDADGHDFDLGLLEHATKLGSLSLRKVAVLRGTLRSQTLGTLKIESSDSEATLGALPELHTIVWSSRNLTSVAGLTGSSASKLILSSNQLEDISELATMLELEHLELDAAVEDLTALGKLKKLSFLALCTVHEDFGAWRGDAPVALTDLRCGRDCYRMTKLDGLECCPSLRSAWLADTRVKDVSGLRDHPTLERLDLSRTAVTDLRPLGVPPRLREIVVTKIKIRDDRIDAALIPALEPPSALKRTKKTRAKRTRAKKKLDPKPKKLAAKIEKLLLARDMERIDQGVELLRGLDDVSLFDALLDGTRYHVSAPDEARLLSEGWLESSSVVLPFRRHAMRAIAGAAPEGSAGAALRSTVDTLLIDGQRTKKEQVPISLNGLAAFDHLRHLRVERATEILQQEVLAKIANLERFELREIAKTPTEIDVPPSLRILVVSAPDLGQLSVNGWETLHTVSLVGGSAPNLSTLRDARTVRIGCARAFASVALDRASLRHLATLEHLEELHLDSVEAPAIDELAARSIRCLLLVGGTHVPLEAVAGLDVEELHLSTGMGTQGRLDLRPLSAMKSLRRIGIAFRTDRLEGLDELDVDRIWTWNLPEGMHEVLGDRWRSLGEVTAVGPNRWIDL